MSKPTTINLLGGKRTTKLSINPDKMTDLRCMNCDQVFDNPTFLKQHIECNDCSPNSHTSYLCKYCNQYSTNEEEFFNHFETFHPRGYTVEGEHLLDLIAHEAVEQFCHDQVKSK